MSETPQYETWEKTTAGGVWIQNVDPVRNTETPKRVRGKSGYRFRIPTRDREATSARFYEAERDPFRNGTLVRVDMDPEAVIEAIPGYDADQALTDEALVAIFAKNGNAFQSAVKKLNERNCRRLADLAAANPETVRAAQVTFLSSYIVENYRVGGAPTDPDD
jgi:hypothetical protein